MDYVVYYLLIQGDGLRPRFPNWGTQSGSGGTRGERFRDNGKRTELPCVLPCKAVFLSNKHNNDRDNEQTLIQEQITEKMSRLCWTTFRPRPLLNCLWTHTHLHV